jgi:hypothetical protein
VFLAGDLFHHWNPPLSLLEWFCRVGFNKDNLIVLPGNHDLPYHREDQLYRSGLGLLIAAGVASLLDKANAPLLAQFVHHFIYETDYPPEWMQRIGLHADELAAKYQGKCNLIVAGDNDHGFLHNARTVPASGHRVLVPGCLTRQSTTEMNWRPVVWLWRADGSLEPAEVPHADAVTICKTEDAPTTEPERDFSAFLAEVGAETPTGAETMLRRVLAEALADVRPGIKERVLKAMEDKP